ncbi:MarR family winged helix-turn-helix transcriptional regulator [soil metagenome]
MNYARHDQFDLDRVDLGELGGSLGFLLRMAQLQAFEAFFRTAGNELKPGEFTVLWVIGLNPGLRQGTIARRLRIKPAHMTKLIRRIVDAGLVEREIPPDDRRSVRLSLTRAGRAFVEKHKATLRNSQDAERVALSDQEYKAIVGLLRKVIGTWGSG